MRNEPLYSVIGYTFPNDERLVLAENLLRSEACQLARKELSENESIYGVSIRPMAREIQGGNNE